MKTGPGRATPRVSARTHAFMSATGRGTAPFKRGQPAAAGLGKRRRSLRRFCSLAGGGKPLGADSTATLARSALEPLGILEMRSPRRGRARPDLDGRFDPRYIVDRPRLQEGYA